MFPEWQITRASEGGWGARLLTPPRPVARDVRPTNAFGSFYRK